MCVCDDDECLNVNKSRNLYISVYENLYLLLFLQIAMSYNGYRNDDSGPGPLPNRWLNCPRKSSSLIAEKFLAFKTPLSEKFNDQVPEYCRFTPSMLFSSMKSHKVSI